MRAYFKLKTECTWNIFSFLHSTHLNTCNLKYMSTVKPPHNVSDLSVYKRLTDWLTYEVIMMTLTVVWTLDLCAPLSASFAFSSRTPVRTRTTSPTQSSAWCLASWIAFDVFVNDAWQSPRPPTSAVSFAASSAVSCRNHQLNQTDRPSTV